MRHETEHKSVDQPDETRKFSNGRAEILATVATSADSYWSRAGAGRTT